jgi:hypothetical protein
MNIVPKIGTEGSSRKYNIAKLVYYETTGEIEAAIAREKQLKGWVGRKKVALMESLNPYWVDLAEGFAPSLGSRADLEVSSPKGDSEKVAHGVN